MRYSIYKVQLSVALGDSFSLAHSLPFVKNFFRGFSRIFTLRFWAEFFDFLGRSYQTSSVCVAICLPLSRALGYTTTPLPICQHLFSCFFRFFRILFYGPFFAYFRHYLCTASPQICTKSRPDITKREKPLLGFSRYCIMRLISPPDSRR